MSLFTDIETRPDPSASLTPVEHIRAGNEEWWLKRDDLFEVAGVRGGKVRTCMALATAALAPFAKGLVTASSRSSPQANIVAHVAHKLGIPAVVHVPEGELSPELLDAQGCGAEVVQHPAGYNSVIIARAKVDAWKRSYTYIPFGMECNEAVRQTRGQVRNVPQDIKRLVIPVGSGMSLAGVLWGLRDAGIEVPVIGVRVGADPTDRLNWYAPQDWHTRVTLEDSGFDYHEACHDLLTFGGAHPAVVVDPYYEGKCLEFLQPGDLFWLVGIRRTATDACKQPNSVA